MRKWSKFPKKPTYKVWHVSVVNKGGVHEIREFLNRYEFVEFINSITASEDFKAMTVYVDTCVLVSFKDFNK